MGQLHINVPIYSSTAVLIPSVLRPQMYLPRQSPDDRAVQHEQNVKWQRNNEVLGEDLPQCHWNQHKCHYKTMGLNTALRSIRQLSACVSACLEWNLTGQ
jgi:hypothetical protein